MKEASVTVKEPAAKKDASTPKQTESIYLVSAEKELGTLKDLVKNISHNGTKPSADSIATELSGMLPAQRASALLGLQRTHGNKYVQRVVAQAKLMVGPIGDTYEQEADRMAEQVVREISTPTVQPIKRQDVKEEEEEEEEELLQGKVETVQRQEPEEEEEEEELMMVPMVQRQPGGTIAVMPDLEAAIQQARGGGHPLSDNVREPMEQAFGADFENVRVHTDSEADKLNKELSAKAFTTGQDVFFREGEYSPGSDSGNKLLAHELTHVVQQTAADIQHQKLDKVDRSAVKDGIIQLVTADGKIEEGDVVRRTSGQQVKYSNLIGGCIAVTAFDGNGALGGHFDLESDRTANWNQFFQGISGSVKSVIINSDMIAQRQGWRVPLRNDKQDLNMTPMGTLALFLGARLEGDDGTKWLANDRTDDSLVWTAKKIHIMDWISSKLGVWPRHLEKTVDISYDVP